MIYLMDGLKTSCVPMEPEANDNSPASKMALYIADFERHCDEREAILEQALQACKLTIQAIDDYAAKIGEFV